MIKLLHGRTKGAFLGESSNVQLVNDSFCPKPVYPLGVIPEVAFRVDYFARPCTSSG